MSFQPSQYSGANVMGGSWPPGSALPNEGETAPTTDSDSGGGGGMDWSALITAVGGITQAGIGVAAQSRAQKSAQAHEAAMAETQGELYVLQTQASQAQGVANQAAAAIQSLATTKTLLIVGGIVLTFGIIAAAVVAVRRGGEEE